MKKSIAHAIVSCILMMCIGFGGATVAAANDSSAEGLSADAVKNALNSLGYLEKEDFNSFMAGYDSGAGSTHEYAESNGVAGAYEVFESDPTYFVFNIPANAEVESFLEFPIGDMKMYEDSLPVSEAGFVRYDAYAYYLEFADRTDAVAYYNYLKAINKGSGEPFTETIEKDYSCFGIQYELLEQDFGAAIKDNSIVWTNAPDKLNAVHLLDSLGLSNTGNIDEENQDLFSQEYHDIYADVWSGSDTEKGPSAEPFCTKPNTAFIYHDDSIKWYLEKNNISNYYVYPSNPYMDANRSVLYEKDGEMFYVQLFTAESSIPGDDESSKSWAETGATIYELAEKTYVIDGEYGVFAYFSLDDSGRIKRWIYDGDSYVLEFEYDEDGNISRRNKYFYVEDLEENFINTYMLYLDPGYEIPVEPSYEDYYYENGRLSQIVGVDHPDYQKQYFYDEKGNLSGIETWEASLSVYDPDEYESTYEITERDSNDRATEIYYEDNSSDEKNPQRVSLEYLDDGTTRFTYYW